LRINIITPELHIRILHLGPNFFGLSTTEET
jgi:hypothetical protein